MASNGVDPTEGYPLFPEEDAPQLGADLEEVGVYAAFRGNMPVGSTTERDAWDERKEGSLWSNVTTDTIDRFDGSSWSVWLKGWAVYTPSLTNISGTVTARYCVVAGMVRVKIHVLVSAITGAVSFSLPVTAAAVSGIPSVGRGTARDVSPSAVYDVAVGLTSTTTVSPIVVAVAGSLVITQNSITATTPHTWANGDGLNLDFSYEAA